MQGVFTKFLQLWIPNKTDKGSVVTDVFEPNFTKLDQNAEIVNKNLTISRKKVIYEVTGIRSLISEKEIYTCNIEEIKDLGQFDVILMMTPNTINTTKNVLISLNEVEFEIETIKGKVSIGELEVVPYIFKLNAITKKAFLLESDKLKKGSYPKDAGALKTEIDTKLNKGGYEGNAKNLYDSIVELERTKLSKGNILVYLENAETIIKMLQGNSGLEFDSNILYIQQSGTKTQNKYYFDVNTGRMHRCLQTTTTVINTTEYFLDESNRGIVQRLETFFNQKLIFENANTYPINTKTIENFGGYKFVIIQVNDFLEPANSVIFTIPTFTITLGKPIFLPANGYRTTTSNIANYVIFTSYTSVEIGETGGGAGQDTITLYYM